MNQYNPFKVASHTMTEVYLAWIIHKVQLDAKGADAPVVQINTSNKAYDMLLEREEAIIKAIQSLTGTARLTLYRDPDLTLYAPMPHVYGDAKSNPSGGLTM